MAAADPASDPAEAAARVAALEGMQRWLWERDRPALSSQGPVHQLEERFRTLTGRRYALAVSSGTAALQLALHGAAVGAGDEVLLSAYDWPAAAAAVVASGARPVPVDIDPLAGTLCATSLSERVTLRSRAVVVTHLGGRPAAMDAITDVARGRGLVVIGDCAQALGATFSGRSVGAWGDAAAFSLGPNKLVDAGEGGVLVTDDGALYEAAVRRSQHPLSQRLRGVEPDALHLNYRMHPCAAIAALPQLDLIDRRLARRRANADALRRALAECPGFRWPDVPAGASPSWWTGAALLDLASWGVPAGPVLRALQARGVRVAAGPIGTALCGLVGCRASDRPCCPHTADWVRAAVHFGGLEAEPAEFSPAAQVLAGAVRSVFGARSLLAA